MAMVVPVITISVFKTTGISKKEPPLLLVGLYSVPFTTSLVNLSLLNLMVA